MNEFKITINGGDLKHEWTPEQWESIGVNLKKLAADVGIDEQEILVTGFYVKANTED